MNAARLKAERDAASALAAPDIPAMGIDFDAAGLAAATLREEPNA